MSRRTLGPPRARALTALAVAATALVVVASPSAADPSDGSGIQSTDLVDSHGVSIDSYILSLDSGSAWNPTDSKKVLAPLTEMTWSLYVQTVKVMILIFQFIVSPGWLDTLIAPIRGLTSGAENIVSTLGLYPFMCLMLAVSVGISIFKGHAAKGMANLGVGVLIAALSIGLLAHPSEQILAEGGWISQAQSASTEVNNELFPGQSNDAMIAQLVDTLVRSPHQIINYGQPVDGTACQAIYDEVLGTDDAWKKVGDCNEDMKTAAQQASGQMIARLVVLLTPVVVGFMTFSYGVIFVLVLVALAAAWSGLSMTWNVVLGIASGGGRHALLRGVASLLVALGALVALYVFITAWMQVTNVVLGSQIDVPAEIRFPLSGIVLTLGPLAALIMYLRARKRAKAAAARLAEATSGRGNDPTDWGRRARQAKTVARHAVRVGRALSNLAPAPPAGSVPPVPVAPPATAEAPRQLPPAPASSSASPRGPRPGGGTTFLPGGGQKAAQADPVTVPSTVRRVSDPRPRTASPERRARALRAAVTVGQVGLAAATGGMSAAVSVAARTVATGALSAGVSRAIGANATAKAQDGPAPQAGPVRATGRRADNTVRAEQLRQRLARAQPVHMERTNFGAVDRDTGQTYRSVRVGGHELLEPRRQS